MFSLVVVLEINNKSSTMDDNSLKAPHLDNPQSMRRKHRGFCSLSQSRSRQDISLHYLQNSPLPEGAAVTLHVYFTRRFLFTGQHGFRPCSSRLETPAVGSARFIILDLRFWSQIGGSSSRLCRTKPWPPQLPDKPKRCLFWHNIPLNPPCTTCGYNVALPARRLTSVFRSKGSPCSCSCCSVPRIPRLELRKVGSVSPWVEARKQTISRQRSSRSAQNGWAHQP